jgi:hypothetical protein
MEHDSLNRLRDQPVPPPDLERRVVNAVRASGGLRPVRTWKDTARMAAAAVLLVTAGFTAGTFWHRQAAAPPNVPSTRWMLLLANDEIPAADGASRAAEYGAWMRDLAARGVSITGDELAGAARVVTTNGREDTVAPLATVGGYFIVDGLSEADAVALAAASPHVTYGGTVVVKRLITSGR